MSIGSTPRTPAPSRRRRTPRWRGGTSRTATGCSRAGWRAARASTLTPGEEPRYVVQCNGLEVGHGAQAGRDAQAGAVRRRGRLLRRPGADRDDLRPGLQRPVRHPRRRQRAGRRLPGQRRLRRRGAERERQGRRRARPQRLRRRHRGGRRLPAAAEVLVEVDLAGAAVDPPEDLRRGPRGGQRPRRGLGPEARADRPASATP